MRYYSQAQDVGSIAEQKAFDISGNFSVSTNFYGTTRESPVRAPFSYFISGAPTISIYGISIPLSLTYSNQQLSYTKPFQRYGASPYYKWVKVHLGHRNLNFSPYSMTGQTFLGAGIELTPGKFRLTAFYGTFENVFAQRDPFLPETLRGDTYKRRGYGMKVGFEGEKSSFDISILKVADTPESANTILTDTLRINPQENIVVSPSVRFTLLKKLVIKSTIAASVLTRNQLAPSGLVDDAFVKKFSSVLVINQSTKLALAGDASINLNLNNFSIGLKYKRVEPLYQSLGLHGITNDFENYTVNTSVSLFKNILQFNASQGFQRNNLSDLRQITSLRKIGSYNLNMSLQNGFNINANYSNFQTDQEAGYIELNDTLRLALVNKSASIGHSFNWKKNDKSHTISAFVSTQNFADLNPREGIILDNKSTNGSINYRLRIKPSNLSFRLALNFSEYESNAVLTNRAGVSVGANKSLADKKLRLSVGASYKKSKVDKQDDGFVVNGRLGLNYNLNKKNSISLSASMLNRQSIIKSPFTDYRGRFTYSFTFPLLCLLFSNFFA